MTENTFQDKRVDQLKQRLEDELVGDDGQPAPAEEIRRVVDDSAEALAEAPIQDFVPILIEHDARAELRRGGLHREFDVEPSGAGGDQDAPHTSSDEASAAHSIDSTSPTALPD